MGITPIKNHIHNIAWKAACKNLEVNDVREQCHESLSVTQRRVETHLTTNALNATAGKSCTLPCKSFRLYNKPYFLKPNEDLVTQICSLIKLAITRICA